MSDLGTTTESVADLPLVSAVEMYSAPDGILLRLGRAGISGDPSLIVRDDSAMALHIADPKVLRRLAILALGAADRAEDRARIRAEVAAIRAEREASA